LVYDQDIRGVGAYAFSKVGSKQHFGDSRPVGFLDTDQVSALIITFPHGHAVYKLHESLAFFTEGNSDGGVYAPAEASDELWAVGLAGMAGLSHR
jgi:hypothetical protein